LPRALMPICWSSGLRSGSKRHREQRLLFYVVCLGGTGRGTRRG
jgi:hypothetical protein